MFAEILPLEHVAFAWILHRQRVPWLCAPLLTLGFLFDRADDHDKLKLREGGAPMHAPDLLRTLPQSPTLLFTNTDHGFNLALAERLSGFSVARLKKDRFDYAVWEHLGRPAAYRYTFEPHGQSQPLLVPYVPQPIAVFEAESAWPLQRATGGSATPQSLPCASNGRVLKLDPQRQGSLFTFTIDLWTANPGSFELVTVADGPLRVTASSLALARATQGSRTQSQARRCPNLFRQWRSNAVSLPAGAQAIRLQVDRPTRLDSLELRAVKR